MRMNPNTILWGLFLLVIVSYGVIYLVAFLNPTLREKKLFSPFENVLMLVTGVLAFWGVYLMGVERGMKYESQETTETPSD